MGRQDRVVCITGEQWSWDLSWLGWVKSMPGRRRRRRWRRRRRRTRRLLEERPGLRTHDWSTRQWPAMSCHEVLGGACYPGNQPVSGLSFSCDEAEEAPKGSLNHLTRTEVVYHVRVFRVRGTEEHLGQFLRSERRRGGFDKNCKST